MYKTLSDGTKTTKLLTVCFSDLQHLSRCCLILKQIQASVQIHFSLARIQLCVSFLPSFSVCCLFSFLLVEGSACTKVGTVLLSPRRISVYRTCCSSRHKITQPMQNPASWSRVQPGRAGLGQAGAEQSRRPGVSIGVSPAGLHGPSLLCLLLTR